MISRFGRAAGDGTAHLATGTVSSIVQRTADDQVCPRSVPTDVTVPTPAGDVVFDYDDFTTSLDEPQECTGGRGHTSWYGSGEVNALNAVTRRTG